MVSGSGKLEPPWKPASGESGCRVVEDEIESSTSEVEGEGELVRREVEDGEVGRLRDLIFCVMRVCENGRA